MRMRVILLASLALLLAGCGTSRIFKVKPDFSRIEVGMTRDEVIVAIGSPDDVRADEDVMYLIYNDNVGGGFSVVEYFVRLVDSRVVSFGRMGDFDSTKVPTLNININKR